MRKRLAILAAVCSVAIAVYAATGPQPRATKTGGVFTNGIVVWPAPLRLYDIYVDNPTPTNEWIMVFEDTFVTTNSPIQTNGAVPRLGPYLVQAGGWFDKDFSYYGMNLDNCYIAISTTSNTFTSAVTNAFIIQAIFDNTTQ